MVKSTSSVSSEYDGLIRSLSNQHHNHHPNGIGGDGNENEANDKTANDSNVPAVNMDDFDVSNMESFLSMMEEQQMKLNAKKNQYASEIQDAEATVQSATQKYESIQAELEDIKSLVKRMKAASSFSLSSKSHSSNKADCGDNDIAIAAAANNNNNSSDDLKAVMNLMLRLWGPVNQKLVAMNQKMEEMKLEGAVNVRLKDLADRFEKLEGAVTNIQSEQEKARESMQEISCRFGRLRFVQRIFKAVNFEFGILDFKSFSKN